MIDKCWCLGHDARQNEVFGVRHDAKHSVKQTVVFSLRHNAGQTVKFGVKT